MLEHVEAFGRGLAEYSETAAAILAALDTYINHDRAKFRRKVHQQIAERLEQCEKRLDAEAINREGFADILSATIETISQTNHEAKVQAAITVLENALLKDGEPGKLEFSELEYFARAVESMSIGAIKALGFAVSNDRKDKRSSSPHADVDVLIEDHFGWDRDFAIGLFRELERHHFVFLEFSNMTYNGKRSATVGTTDLGFRFHDHVLNQRTT